MSPKCNAAAAGATKGVVRTAPTIEKRAPAEKLTVDAARAAADLNLAPAQTMSRGTVKSARDSPSPHRK